MPRYNRALENDPKLLTAYRQERAMAGKKPESKARKSTPAPSARKSGAGSKLRPASKARSVKNPVKAPAKTPVKPQFKAPVKVTEKKVVVPAKKPVPVLKSVGKGPGKPVVAVATMKLSTVAAPQGEDSDGFDSGSLLAGPRNVKPYIARRGERYMSKEQLMHFQTILKSWKQDLMVEVDRTVTHMKDEAANFPDPNDRATQEEEFSLELRTRDRERKLIRKIDEALKRTEDGSYGYCLETGEEIGIKRLEARPVATLTIEAQERRERRERQYGDRDDRYR
jgi:DnaK suppressor protein